MPDLLYEKLAGSHAGIAVLTFNRPERRNAFCPS